MICSCRREAIRQQGGHAAITRQSTCHAYVKLMKQTVETQEQRHCGGDQALRSGMNGMGRHDVTSLPSVHTSVLEII